MRRKILKKEGVNMDDRMEEQLWETKKQIELLYSTCLQEYFPEL